MLALTIISMLVVTAAVAHPSPTRAPTGDPFKRAVWLEHRLAYHTYVVNNGDGKHARWHGRALKWTKRELGEAREDFRRRLERNPDRVGRLSQPEIVEAAELEIAHGGILSTRYAGATTLLRTICYEMVDRAFAPYGTQSFARRVMNQESGCNPGAVNATSGVTGIAQFDLDIHTWADGKRLKHSLPYAIAAFLRLSRNGTNTGPWCLC